MNEVTAAPVTAAPVTVAPVTVAPVAALPWSEAADALDAHGCAVLPRLLDAATCRTIAGWYDEAARFRSAVIMARHGFGRGEYRYFADPPPPIIRTLRQELYPPLAAIADRWAEALRAPGRFPADLAGLAEVCRAAGQTRPTPLLLRYGPGDFNCLHQDLYGAVHFPLQVAILLSEPGRDFEGGEFVLTEQRPRRQSRVEVVPLRQGDAVVFPVRDRPVRGGRGVYRVNLRHGVSRIRSGRRYALGVIFHDSL